MKTLTKSMVGTFLLVPSLVIAIDHNHNHFNPKLELLGNDIISLTVCYNNGYLSEQDQQPAFENLIAYAGVDGEELGMYYMNNLGAKAEEIMSSGQGNVFWTEKFCADLTMTYLDPDKLKKKSSHDIKEHDHDHHHNEHELLSVDILEEDAKRGRLLRVN